MDTLAKISQSIFDIILFQNILSIFLFEKKLALFSCGLVDPPPLPLRTRPLKMQDFFNVLPNGSHLNLPDFWHVLLSSSFSSSNLKSQKKMGKNVDFKTIWEAFQGER